MSYLVFARKYRPQTFVEILGQGPIVTTLTNAIRQHRIAHAYLFAGPRGTGKTSTARIFAKALNCVEGPTVTPCLKCDRCQEITRGGSLDVLEIDGASNRGIDQIRALRELAKFTPMAGAFKVYIIDEVHQITSEGFNALLKTLEEPPPHVLFILATTAPHKVPATILSRCQRYDFKRLPMEVIAAKIRSIAALEKLEIAQEAVMGITRAASGSLRDAESLLDQVAAFTGGRIRAQDIQTLLGTIEEDTFAEAMAGIQARDPVQLLKLVAQATNAGTDLIQWALSFLIFLRNLLVAKVGAGPLGFEDLGPESIERLKSLSSPFSIEELTLIAQALTGAVETMRRVGEPRIPLEMVLVRLSAGESMASVSSLLERLEGLEERLRNPQTSERKDPNPTPKPAAASSALLEQAVAAWPTLLEQIRQQKASAAAYLSEATPFALEGDPPQVVIGFPKGFEFHKGALDRGPTRQLIEQALGTLIGRTIRCCFRIADSLPARSSSTGQASAVAEAASETTLEVSPKPDPAHLTSIVELFEGRVLPEEG